MLLTIIVFKYVLYKNKKLAHKTLFVHKIRKFNVNLTKAQELTTMVVNVTLFKNSILKVLE